MLEYMTELWKAQRRIAAQFDPAAEPQIPDYEARGKKKKESEAQSGAQTEKRAEPSFSLEDGPGGGKGGVEARLGEMKRAVMRMESMQMQKAAEAAQAQARSQERHTREVCARQSVALTEKKMELGEGGLTGSYEKTLRTGGIASAPGQASMQEISRFFERDARRYG